MKKEKGIDKSPVKLRAKKIAGGNRSLYLDIYNNGKRKKEYLKLYLIPEKSEEARKKNSQVLELAETIRAERILNLQSNKSLFFSSENKEAQISFADYMAQEIERMKKLRTKNYYRKYKCVETWVRKYDSRTALEEVNKKWVQGFVHFLSITPGKYGRKLNQNTIYVYLIYIANILNNAVREGLIASSPTKSLSISDRPKNYDTSRAYLTEEEINKLREVPSPSKYNDIRRAFLFACYCGLRYSDLQQLKWKNIKKTADGVTIDMKLQKTQTLLYLPLNKTALQLLPERQKDNDLVFTLPKSMVTTEAYIKVWSEFAQIDKHITFHSSRHTFAVNILAKGGDIYTLSKLLGHKKVSTTQIYAEVLGESKKRTIELLDD